jgi:two-component system, OmpR family, response regulator
VKHVLVVDDDPTMRDVVGSYLENNNFRVSFAADGQAMNRVLTNQPVDLMILDLKLTEEDGLELMQDMGAQTDVPIIVLTGHRRDETDRVVGLELGADDYPISGCAMASRAGSLTCAPVSSRRRPEPPWH